MLRNTKMRIILPIISLLVLSGCWSSRELSDSAILAGAGVEKEGNEYKIAYQVMDPKKIKKQESEASVIVIHKGSSIHEASGRLVKGLQRLLFLSHTTTVILGSELAREEGVSVLDLGNRDQQFRLNSYIYVADKPLEILGIHSPLENVSSFGLSKGSDTIKYEGSQMTAVTIREFMKDHLGPTHCAYATFLKKHIEDKPAFPHIDINGPAIFKQGKLVKIIQSLSITRGILWFQNKIHFGSITVNIPKDPKSRAAVEIHDASVKMKTKLDKGEPVIHVHVSAKGDINEWGSEEPLDLPTLYQIEKEIKKKIAEEMNAAVRAMREEPVTDILNIGLEVYRKHPKYWNANKDDWDDIFKHLDVRIHVDAKIKNVGFVKDRNPDPPRSNLFPWKN